MVAQFDQHYETWSAVSQECAEVDALMGFARASRDGVGDGPMVRPNILPNDHTNAVFRAQGIRNPILAQIGSFVANDVALGEGGETDIMIVTGPNADGKSTIARQVVLSVILAQVGCYVRRSRLHLGRFGICL